MPDREVYPDRDVYVVESTFEGSPARLIILTTAKELAAYLAGFEFEDKRPLPGVRPLVCDLRYLKVRRMRIGVDLLDVIEGRLAPEAR